MGDSAARAISSSLRHVRGAVLSASKSSWTILRQASTRSGQVIAQREPAVRAWFARVGKSMASAASSMARASLGTLARARAASARLLEEGAARRQAALARAAEAAAQKAEAARVEVARREAEAVQAAAVRQQAEAAQAAARRQADALAREQAEPARGNAEAARPSVDVPVGVPAITEPMARSRSTAAARQASNGTMPPLSVPVPAAMAPAVDLEDTGTSDPPFRYLALASRDGFALITNSQTSDQSDFWLLEDADSGMLLTVVTSDLGVREAVLHYNLRTDDDRLLQRTPPEHRDLDSRTIYVRESAVEGLRARIRRLRTTGALVREWKISPPIDLPLRR